MSIGTRLKEERVRLGLSQADLAARADSSARAQLKWEKDASTPTGNVLAAFAEVGVDVLYVLTGKRTNDRPDIPITQIEDQLAGIRRDMIDPTRRLMPGEDRERAEQATLRGQANALRAILNHDAPLLTPALREEAERLLEIISSPEQLSLFRAADYVQMRAKRRDAEKNLTSWLETAQSEVVMNLLVTIHCEYSVPIRLLAELVERVVIDASNKDGDQ